MKKCPHRPERRFDCELVVVMADVNFNFRDEDAFNASVAELKLDYPEINIDRFVTFGLKRLQGEPWASDFFEPESPEHNDKRLLYIHATGVRDIAVIMFTLERDPPPHSALWVEVVGLSAGYKFNRKLPAFRKLVGLE